MLAEFTIDGHQYKGPMPTGADAHELMARIWGLLCGVGFGDLADNELTPQVLARFLTVQRLLAASPIGQELARETLTAWKVDDLPITESSIPKLYTGRRIPELYAAVLRIWRDAGVFHVCGFGDA